MLYDNAKLLANIMSLLFTAWRVSLSGFIVAFQLKENILPLVARNTVEKSRSANVSHKWPFS